MKFKQIFLSIILVALVLVVVCCGCSHNTGSFTVGTRLQAGIDPQSATANMSYTDGLNVVDVSRENSRWRVEVDGDAGVQISESGSIKGLKVLEREVGPQVTGYLTELAEICPDAALEYAKATKYYWQYKASESKK